MLTSGFGLRARRFVMTLIITIIAFSGLYLADDIGLSGCGGSMSWKYAARTAYYAIANLTTVGTNPGPCGPYTGILASVEALLGYFLLSVLAAMLFAWLTDR
jgi:hypothetical protein